MSKRIVGEESRKTYQHKMDSGFFAKYMSGKGCEIGYAGYVPGCQPILENCEGFDKGTDGYDGKTIPRPDNYYDYLYTSHTLEHIEDYKHAIQEWFRVVKKNGYIIIVVPHRDLYEKKLDLPSNFNSDHQRFYLPDTLLKEIRESLPLNSYQPRHLRVNDEGHNYQDPPEKHANWLYEIEVVIEKIV